MSKKSGRKLNTSDKGFTLVELLVVLVILAVMAAIAVPAMLGFTDSAKEKEYTAQADSALKATQSVLSDLYNNAENRLVHAKRYGAANTANIDPDTTVFRVWTAGQLKDGSTAAVAENISSYTVQYAIFKISRDEEKSQCVYYDGKKWTVYDKESDIPSFAGDDENINNRVINMWPDYTEKADAGNPYRDTAYNKNVSNSEGYDWENGENTSVTKDNVTITLCGYNKNSNQPWVQMKNIGTSAVQNEIQVVFELIRNNGEPQSVNPKEWYNATQINKDSVSYTIEYVTGFSGDILWSTSSDKTGNLSYGDIKNKILSGDIESGARLYAWATKDIESKTITLKAFNPNTLSFGSGNDSQISVSVNKYINPYDSARGYVSEINTELEAAISNDNLNYDKEFCQFGGFAFCSSKDEYEKTSDGDNLVSYSTVLDIYNKVFGDVPQNIKDGTFVGIITQNKSVILQAGSAPDEEEIRSHMNGKTDYTVSLVEILGQYTDDLDDYSIATNKIQVDTGYRFDYWETESAPGRKFYEIDEIRSYVESDASSQSEYIFKAVLKKRGTALLMANDTDGDSFKNQVKSMAGGSNSNLVSFTRIDWNAFKEKVGDKINEITVDGNKDEAKSCGSEHAGSFPLGNNKTAYILYDGKKEGFTTPVYAYSEKKSNGTYEASWFCADDITLEAGSFASAFDGCSKLNFSGSEINSWDVSECTNMKAMFKGCSSASSIEISSWDTRAVRNISEMFSGCSALTGTLDISNFYTNKVTDFSFTFLNCKNLVKIKVNSGKFTSSNNVTTVESMFESCEKLEGLDLRGFGKCDNLTSIKRWFYHCYHIQYIDLSNFETKNLNNISSSFCLVGKYDGNKNNNNLSSQDGCTVYAKCKWECAANCTTINSGDDSTFNYFRIRLFGKVYKNSNDVNAKVTGKTIPRGDPSHLDVCREVPTEFVNGSGTVSTNDDKRLFRGYFMYADPTEGSDYDNWKNSNPDYK